MTLAITYISRPTAGVGPRDVQNIWITALDRNAAMEITGALYYDGEFFLQVLEGEEEDVEPLYKMICNDSRHGDVRLLAMNDLAAVMFRETPMKFIDASQSPALRQRFVFDDLANGGPDAANRAVFQLLKL